MRCKQSFLETSGVHLHTVESLQDFYFSLTVHSIVSALFTHVKPCIESMLGKFLEWVDTICHPEIAG